MGKLSNILVKWSLGVIHAKKYENVAKFVKVTYSKQSSLFVQTRCIYTSRMYL